MLPPRTFLLQNLPNNVVIIWEDFGLSGLTKIVRFWFKNILFRMFYVVKPSAATNNFFKFYFPEMQIIINKQTIMEVCHLCISKIILTCRKILNMTFCYLTSCIFHGFLDKIREPNTDLGNVWSARYLNVVRKHVLGSLNNQYNLSI